MADDVRISVGLPRHPKTKKLRRRVGTEGCWSLIVLFLWVGAERWDGNLEGMTDEDIELAAEWDGDPDAFVAAMVEVGFLRGEPGERALHAWQEHNPYAAGKGARIAKGKAAAEARWGKRDAAAKPKDARGIKKDARSIGVECSEHAASSSEQCPPAPAPTPSPSIYSERFDTPPVVPAAPADVHGRFEGHAIPDETPNPAARHAIALNRAGYRCTSYTPDLVEAVREGVTVDHLLQAATLPECAGKPAAYVIRIARREHTEAAKPIVAGAPKAGGQTYGALADLEEMKRGLAVDRGAERLSAIDHARLEPPAGT